MWIAFDFVSYGFELCKTEEEAKKMAQQDVNYELKEDNKWDPDMEGAIGYARVIWTTKEKVMTIRGVNYTHKEWEEKGYDPDCDSVSTFELVPVD